ncbi:AlbA family DNA-binding domain-containing protein [Streptomyces tirandamycinicus]|nr:ATP-binding protein [Streptomyces tirandamycinicus]
MARSWTRLHEYLGAPPGPVTFDMVKRAAGANLAESDDLDWKEQLPQPPRDGRWNELAKDVAAMASTRGGLLVFGVRDRTTEPVGIDPDEVNSQQYAQWIRNHVQPYLPDVTFTTLTSPDRALSFLVIDIPPSPMAPHHVYGTAAKDKDQQAAVVPYRDADHTAWMAEHQIERAYRDRFTRTQHAQDELEWLIAHTRENVLAEQAEPSAWFLAVARPERPLPRTAPPLARENAAEVCATALACSRDMSRNYHVVGPLTALNVVMSYPRPGLRRWVFSTLPLRTGRGVLAELHHDGSIVLAANLSWKALRGDHADPDTEGIVVDADVTGASCRDVLALARELGRRLGVDSTVHVTATITTAQPAPLTPVVTEYASFKTIPDHARRPRRIQPVTALVTLADTDDVLRESAQESFTDLMNQFGLTARLQPGCPGLPRAAPGCPGPATSPKPGVVPCSGVRLSRGVRFGQARLGGPLHCAAAGGTAVTEVKGSGDGGVGVGGVRGPASGFRGGGAGRRQRTGPGYLDAGSGSHMPSTREWWAYDGTLGSPRPSHLRAVCSCGWRCEHLYRIDWGTAADDPETVDTSAARTDFDGHLHDLEARSLPLPAAMTDLVERLDEQLHDLAADSPLAALKAIAALERITLRIARHAAADAQASADEDELSWETVARTFGTDHEYARARLMHYQLRV